MSNSNLKVYVLRLRPNQDLFKELDQFVRENDLKAAFIMTCVGSLTKATIRMAYSGMQHNEVLVNFFFSGLFKKYSKKLFLLIKFFSIF